MAHYAPGINTKSKIVNSAKTLFYDRGYCDVSLTDICGHAGVSRTLFFHYFKGKDELAFFIMKWANNIYAHQSLEIINREMNSLSPLVKELVFDGMVYRSSIENPNVERFYAEMVLNIPEFYMTEENEEKLRYRLNLLGIEKSDEDIVMANAFIAGATLMMTARYLKKPNSITGKQFVEQLIRTTLAITAADYYEKDAVVAEAMKAIYAYDIDFNEIFLEKYTE